MSSSSRKSWNGTLVAITGSSRGIGRETARLFARQGARVILNGRNPETLLRTAAEFQSQGLDVLTLCADMTNPHDAERLAQFAMDHGGLDVFIANAGIAIRGLFADLRPEALEQVTKVNVLGTLYSVHAAWPQLLKSSGRLVLVSTMAGIHGLPGVAAYSATKAPMALLAQALDIEGRDSGASVTTVFVGRAEDDPDKTTLAADGSLVPLRKSFSQSQEFVAKHIVRAAGRRRRSVVLSFGGKAYGVLGRVAPGFIHFVMTLARKRMIEEARGGVDT